MDVTPMVLATGVVGGLVIACLMVLVHRRRQANGRPDLLGTFNDSGKTDVINIAAIRVAGVGGLGLVIVALAVALDIPRVGQTLILAATLGVLMAAALILRRRQVGPMPSSGLRNGANTTLSIDVPPGSAVKDDDETLSPGLRSEVPAL